MEVSKLCKTWTSQNFGPASLHRYKNNTFQLFDLKICPKEDAMLGFH